MHFVSRLLPPLCYHEKFVFKFFEAVDVANVIAKATLHFTKFPGDRRRKQVGEEVFLDAEGLRSLEAIHPSSHSETQHLSRRKLFDAVLHYEFGGLDVVTKHLVHDELVVAPDQVGDGNAFISRSREITQCHLDVGAVHNGRVVELQVGAVRRVTAC